MSALERYLRLEQDVRRAPELEAAEPITDAAIDELLTRWPTIKAWWVFDLMRGCTVRIREQAAEIERLRGEVRS